MSSIQGLPGISGESREISPKKDDIIERFCELKAKGKSTRAAFKELSTTLSTFKKKMGEKKYHVLENTLRNLSNQKINKIANLSLLKKTEVATANALTANNVDAEAAYAKTDQTRWQEFSKIQIDSVKKMIGEKFPEHGEVNLFSGIYWEMARQRGVIAREIDPDNPLLFKFGERRSESMHTTETLIKDSLTQYWKTIASNVFKRAESLKATEKGVSVTKIENFNLFQERFQSRLKELLGDRDENSLNAEERKEISEILESEFSAEQEEYKGIDDPIVIKSPFKEQSYQSRYLPLKENHTKRLMTIQWQMYDNGSQGLVLTYPGVNKYDSRGDFLIANDYLIDAIVAKTPKEFMQSLGRMMHLMAQVLPVNRGNASMMEWMVRGVAAEKGVDLGPGVIGGQDELGWDFEAFLTPNREDYAKWYEEKAFPNVDFSSFRPGEPK